MRTGLQILALACAIALISTLATPAEAGWGRYRITTYYSTPSVPAYYGSETLVVPQPVIVTPAPVVVTHAPVVSYYAAPAVYVPAPVVQPVIRATYYAPAPRRVIYRPAPVTYFYPGTVILP